MEFLYSHKLLPFRYYEIVMRKDFGEWLRGKIKELGFTQKEFANLIGIEQPHLSRIISGTRGTSEDVLKRIANALGLPESYVIDKALNVSRPDNIKREKLNEALAILSTMTDEEIEEIIEMAKLKKRLRKSKTSTPSRAQKPARSALKEK
jgi:transcriptional regulator with XRE-family HTH domain